MRFLNGMNSQERYYLDWGFDVCDVRFKAYGPPAGSFDCQKEVGYWGFFGAFCGG